MALSGWGGWTHKLVLGYWQYYNKAPYIAVNKSLASDLDTSDQIIHFDHRPLDNIEVRSCGWHMDAKTTRNETYYLQTYNISL